MVSMRIRNLDDDPVLVMNIREIAVMYKGQIIATLDAGEATREELGLLMAGVTESAEAIVAVG